MKQIEATAWNKVPTNQGCTYTGIGIDIGAYTHGIGTVQDSDPREYRPISLLSVVSKKHIRSLVFEHLMENGLLCLS